MILHSSIWFKLLLVPIFMGLFSCSRQSPDTDGKVHILKTGGQFTLYRNGKPYQIKGAAGFSHLPLLKKSGANTIRVWDTTGLSKILTDAHANDLAVIVGLPIPESRHMTLYNDDRKTALQLMAIKKLVNTYKSHPALLMWCVGNELSFPYRIRYNNFYKAFNEIVDMIHENDPDHPVTTTMVNFQWQEVMKIKLRTNIDFVSFNIFGRLKTFRQDINAISWIYKDPYLITEWGIDGPWDAAPRTEWEAYIEPNSTQKAVLYEHRFTTDIPVEDPRNLGSFLFFWGHKQEVTSTWFSLFDQAGNQTEAVAAAQFIWTGKKPATVYPRIHTMYLNGKQASDNIVCNADAKIRANVHLEAGISGPVKVKWEVFKEDWFKVDNKNNEKSLLPVQTDFQNKNELEVEFITPRKNGPYRIFVTIDDNKGHIATANIPFYIAGSHEKN